MIATLEALAVLLAVKHLLPKGTAQTESQSVAVTQVLTDNRGNGHILSKLHSTKFPISAIVMELAFMLKEKGLQAEVSWIPRESNTEADELSNLDVSRFSPEHRVDVDLANEDWRFFHKALLLGKQYITDALERKNGRTDVGRSKKVLQKGSNESAGSLVNGAAEVSHTAVRSRIVLLEMFLFALVSFDGLEVSASFGWWSSRVDRMFACGSLVYFSGFVEWLC